MAGAISLQRQPEAQERLPFVRKSGKNPGKIQMEQFIPVEYFREKSGYTFVCITFFSPAFTVTTEFFCTICFGLQEQDFLWRESERFIGIS